jgi:hypothetical protein
MEVNMSDDHGTEAERMDEWLTDADIEEIETGMNASELRQTKLEDRVEHMVALYERARNAQVGTQIVCPTCGRTHVKTTYHKVFCSNQKRKRRNNGRKRSCKDVYWNSVNDERRERAVQFNQ